MFFYFVFNKLKVVIVFVFVIRLLSKVRWFCFIFLLFVIIIVLLKKLLIIGLSVKSLFKLLCIFLVSLSDKIVWYSVFFWLFLNNEEFINIEWVIFLVKLNVCDKFLMEILYWVFLFFCINVWLVFRIRLII